MKRSWLFIVGALTSCSDAKTLRLDVPIDDVHRSMIVATRVEQQQPRLFARTIATDRTIDAIPFSYRLDQTVVVTALLLDRALSFEGLSPGELSPAPEGGPTVGLPNTSTITQSTITDDERSDWRQVALPDDLARYRLPSPERCPRFEGRAISIGTNAPPRFVLNMDDEWALVGLDSRRLFAESNRVVFMNADGRVVEQSDLPSIFYSGYRRSDGRIWLGGQAGVIYEATFTASPEPRIDLTVTSTVDAREDVIDLEGSGVGEDFEQFALTSDRGEDEVWGNFEWFDGTDWTYASRRNRPREVTRVGPGHGVFSSFWRDGEIQGARDGVESIEIADSVIFGSVLSVQLIPGVGLVAGTSAGEVHVMANGGWRRVSSVDAQQVLQPHVYGDGFVYQRGRTSVGIYVDDATRCEDATVDRFDLVFEPSMTVVSDAIVIPLADPMRSEDAVEEQFVAWMSRL